jgi:hypothetical protein
MRINSKILDFTTIYNNHKLGELLELYSLFNDAVFDLEICLILLKEDYDSLADSERDEEYEFVSNQLFYAKKNLKTIEKAILCHECDIFERIKIGGVVFNFCLN